MNIKNEDVIMKINLDQGRNCDWIRIVRDKNEAPKIKKTKKKFTKEFGDDEAFTFLISRLIIDALYLLPVSIKRLIKKNKKAIIEDAVTYYREKKFPKHYPESQDLGGQASYTLMKVYGKKPTKITIPRAIYYDGFEEGWDFNNKLVKGKKQLNTSRNLSRDTYNLALNLLVNLWLSNLRKSRKKISPLPKEGVYLRDANKRLYLYEEA